MTRRRLLLIASARALFGEAREPQNLSYPLQRIAGSVTPPDLFFVRDHFREPDLSLSAWKLKIEGRVARPFEAGLSDILEAPTRKVESVLECAGNAAGGSAASNGVWEGVPLSYLLEQAGPQRGATRVLLEGADAGRLMQDSPRLPYCQLVSLDKCLQPDSLVAFKLNDQFLARRQGFPARALLPGWYAMDSVKWLARIVVLGNEDPPSTFQESGMDRVYNRVIRGAGGEPRAARLTEIQVKSAIAWPTNGARLPAARLSVWGFAWSGTGVLRGVEVSTDGGRNWQPAKLASPPKRFAWVRWSYDWPAAPGDYVLMSRAADEAGQRQPLLRDPARKDGYELNFCAPVRCAVR